MSIAHFPLKSSRHAASLALWNQAGLHRDVLCNRSGCWFRYSITMRNTGGKFTGTSRNRLHFRGSRTALRFSGERYMEPSRRRNELPLISIFDNKRIRCEMRARARRYTDQSKREESTDRGVRLADCLFPNSNYRTYLRRGLIAHKLARELTRASRAISRPCARLASRRDAGGSDEKIVSQSNEE